MDKKILTIYAQNFCLSGGLEIGCRQKSADVDLHNFQTRNCVYDYAPNQLLAHEDGALLAILSTHHSESADKYEASIF